jgi:broad specificity phosphatase PhoE
MIAIRALIIPILACTSFTFNPTLPPVSSANAIAETRERIMPSPPSANKQSEKTIYLIRHAESLENLAYQGARNIQAAYSSRKFPAPRDVGDAFQLAFKMFRPTVMNAALSEMGEEQVYQLYTNLRKDQFWDKLKEAQGAPEGQMAPLLMVHSPLTRAKQTAYGVLLGPDQMAPNTIQEIQKDADDNVIIQEGVRIQELDSLQEVNPPEIIRDALSPWRKRKKLDFRVEDFERWIESRPESTIVVVGHSMYFKRMLNLPKSFDNCDIWEAKYGMSPSSSSSSSEEETKSRKEDQEQAVEKTKDLPRSWKSLRRLYWYQPSQ